jgi:ribonucleoside-triphosphate reductase
MNKLDKKIFECKDELIERFTHIASQPPTSATFMYQNQTMAGYHLEEGIISALKHGTLAIGQLGLAETLEILVGCNHTKPRGMKVAIQIESMFKEICAKYKEEYKLNFGVYYTPAENLCYTALKKFRNQYGIIPKVSDREYFTNSIHVPVWEQLSPFEKIDIESQLTGFSSAGCITYVELEGRVLHNIDALEQLVVYAMHKDIPYFALNVPADLCIDCGYEDLIENNCPRCGSSNVQRLRRVTGYLTGDYKSAFNLGKQAEVEDRYKHSNKLEFSEPYENSGHNEE